MKINYILPGIFKSGGVRVIFDYANLLTNLGHDVCIYFPIIPQDYYSKSYNIYRVKNYFRTLVNNLKNFFSKNYYTHKFKIKKIPFLSELFIRDADFTIATAWPTAFFVNKLGSQKGVKIYFIQDYEIWNSNIKQVDLSYTLPLNKLTISKNLKDFFKEKFGIDCKVIYNGLDKDKFYFENNSKNFTLKKVLFIDNGLPKKNVTTLVSVIIKLKEIYPDLEFISFGMLNYTKMPSYIRFYENPDDNLIRKLYNEADLFIYPSLSEGFGLPPAEAMACRCAAASTSVGAVPEYITHCETGFIIKNDDLSDLPELVELIIKNPKLLQKVSENGNKKIEEFFNWDKSIQNFIEYLNYLHAAGSIYNNSKL